MTLALRIRFSYLHVVLIRGYVPPGYRRVRLWAWLFAMARHRYFRAAYIYGKTVKRSIAQPCTMRIAQPILH